VIEKYADKDDFLQNQSGKGFRGAKLSPFACRLKNGKYSFREKDYSLQKFYLGTHAMHGLLYDAFFTTLELNAGEDYACVKMIHNYNGSDKGYPFKYSCTVEYTLNKENKLSVTTTLHNESEEAIPVSDGWHPYFTFGKNIDELQLEFQTGTQLEFDADMIPTGKERAYEDFVAIKNIGEQKFDDCFRLNFEACQPMVVLRDKALRLQLEILPAKSYPFLQIYIPQERLSIALENLSAAPDCFNNGIGVQVLEPGQKTSFYTSFRLVSF
jgi:aldose 1-epimerase